MADRDPTAEPHAAPGGEDTGDIVREVRIEAPPEAVFEFFTDPKRYVRWKGRAAELEPEPGGRYRVEISSENVVRGEFVDIDPPRRVVFTWGWEGGPLPPGATTVEVEFVPDGDGTLLRLTHRGLPEDAKGEHLAGWDHFLPRLQQAAAGADPGADPWFE